MTFLHTPAKILLKALTRLHHFGIIYFVVNAPLAQVVEHLTFNQGVKGSSPLWRIL